MTSILLTGATGFLGRSFVRHFDGQVYALVRGRDYQERLAGLARDSAAQVIGIRGDVTAPGLGMGHELDALRGKVELVVNLAAETSWVASSSDLNETNVHGACNAASVAHDLRVPLLHVSSLFAAFCNSGVVREEFVAESAELTRYERSKCRGELAVREFCLATSTPCVVVRVGGLSGDARPGVGRPARPALGQLLTRRRLPILPYAADARLDLSPRDLVADALCRMVDGARFEGDPKVVHIGLGEAAPSAAAVLAEARVRRSPQRRGAVPLRLPAGLLMSVSAAADRWVPGPRGAMLIGLRYLASSAVYRSQGLGVDVALDTHLRALGTTDLVQAPNELDEYYGGWTCF